MRGRFRGPPPLLAVLVLVVALVPGSGCERRSQDAPATTAPGAALVASADFGARELLSTRVSPEQSVMRALRGATSVRTAYAGGFVSQMLGLSSDPSSAGSWLFFVNGIGSSVGARAVRVEDGDSIWWDYRAWRGLPETPAVVGQWPAPLVHPNGDGPRVVADPPLRAVLAAAGGRLTDADSPWRARVGTSVELARRDPAWRRALADPDGAGLTVAIEHGVITALGPDGATRTPVAGARALIAAVATAGRPEDGVLVAVVGLDDEAARRTAATVVGHPEVLHLRYAVVFDADGRPLVAGGRTTP